MKRSHQDQSKRYLSGKRNTGCHHTYEKYAGRRHVTFFRQSYRSLVVVDKNDKILGIVAPNDVLKAVHSYPETVTCMTVSEVMTEDM